VTIHTELQAGPLEAASAEPGLSPGDGAVEAAGAEPLALRGNKLDLLERLADDLAHEIKNPLHSMVINLEVLKRRIARVAGEEGDLQRYIGVIAGELERVNRRIELLLRLARPGRGAETTTMSELADELMELIQLEARHHEAAVDYQPGDGMARVRVAREPARQVILNLVLEALDGTDSAAPLTLRIRRDGGDCHLAVGRGEAELPPAFAEEPAGPGPLGVASALARSVHGRVGTHGDGAGRVLVFTLPLAGG
jgi:signal transduction histidine kinase